MRQVLVTKLLTDFRFFKLHYYLLSNCGFHFTLRNGKAKEENVVRERRTFYVNRYLRVKGSTVFAADAN